jgi:hypothetical protein
VGFEPTKKGFAVPRLAIQPEQQKAGLTGFEPAITRWTVGGIIQLCYKPKLKTTGIGIEPISDNLTGWRITVMLSRIMYLSMTI